MSTLFLHYEKGKVLMEGICLLFRRENPLKLLTLSLKGPAPFNNELIEAPILYEQSAPCAQRLAHRNRSDFCDCDAHRGLQKSRDFRDKRQQCCIAISGCDGKSLAICDFGLRFLSPKSLLSAGFLAIWLRQRGNR